MSINKTMASADKIKIEKAEVCYDWPLGRCPHGKYCTRLHHENLNPGLTVRREHPDYMVPNEVNVACDRCLQAFRACDKKGRSGQDDPCSECRWFGGDNCRCLIVPSSYNDQAWALMIRRGDRDYTLPQPKSRDAVKEGKAAPAPLSSHKLKANWQGDTRELLMLRRGMLPTFVLDHPRAYLVPPRPSARKTRSAQNKVILGKRESKSRVKSPAAVSPFAPASPYGASPWAPAAASPSNPSLPQFLFGPPNFPRPASNPLYGWVVTRSWSYVLNRWELTYENGFVLALPAQVGNVSTPASHRTPYGGNADMGPARVPVRGGGYDTAREGLSDHQQQPQRTQKPQREQDSSACPDSSRKRRRVQNSSDR